MTVVDGEVADVEVADVEVGIGELRAALAEVTRQRDGEHARLLVAGEAAIEAQVRLAAVTRERDEARNRGRTTTATEIQVAALIEERDEARRQIDILTSGYGIAEALRLAVAERDRLRAALEPTALFDTIADAIYRRLPAMKATGRIGDLASAAADAIRARAGLP